MTAALNAWLAPALAFAVTVALLAAAHRRDRRAQRTLAEARVLLADVRDAIAAYQARTDASGDEQPRVSISNLAPCGCIADGRGRLINTCEAHRG